MLLLIITITYLGIAVVLFMASTLKIIHTEEFEMLHFLEGDFAFVQLFFFTALVSLFWILLPFVNRGDNEKL